MVLTRILTRLIQTGRLIPRQGVPLIGQHFAADRIARTSNQSDAPKYRVGRFQIENTLAVLGDGRRYVA